MIQPPSMREPEAASPVAAADEAATGQRPIDPQALAAVLRRLARADGAPWLHGEVARRMAERLPVIRLQPRHVVDWWSFLGGGGRLLAAAYPQARFTVVEPTAALVDRSRAAWRSPWWSTRRWLRAEPAVVLDGDGSPASADRAQLAISAAAPATAEPVQLVWSNMVLHAAIDPPAVIARWHRLLEPGGFAMFSCLGPGTLRELRELYAPIGRAAGIEFVDMHDLGDMMVHAGFADPVMDQETITLQWEDPQALLAELRSLGGNVAVERPAGLRTRRFRSALETALDAMRGPDGRLAMRFEIAYGHAFKAAPRRPAGSETRVSLDAMRELVRGTRVQSAGPAPVR